ncbi:hypothetical protein [Streptomyces sp. NPDC000410]|uniref:hypothetical protein n=1 Tax=Streptomyces sp. NPDC000410 TaxID=3154254 RepID=UPI00331FEC3A
MGYSRLRGARRRHSTSSRFVGVLMVLTVVSAALTGLVVPDLAVADVGARGQLAATGSVGERLWLLGGVAVAVTAAGAIALAATRDRRRDH